MLLIRDPLTTLMSSPCSSVVRSFRAAASITASQLVTSWIRAVLSLTEARDTAQRQMEVEMRKKSKVCSPPPLTPYPIMWSPSPGSMNSVQTLSKALCMLKTMAIGTV